MRYKRDESFRFAFGNPLPALFSITKVDHELISMPEGEAQIIDISPNGMKLSTFLDIPVTGRDVSLSIRFKLNETHFVTQGNIVWKKQDLQQYHYGISLHLEESHQDKLIEELKLFSRKKR